VAAEQGWMSLRWKPHHHLVGAAYCEDRSALLLRKMGLQQGIVLLLSRSLIVMAMKFRPWTLYS